MCVCACWDKMYNILNMTVMRCKGAQVPCVSVWCSAMREDIKCMFCVLKKDLVNNKQIELYFTYLKKTKKKIEMGKEKENNNMLIF